MKKYFSLFFQIFFSLFSEIIFHYFLNLFFIIFWRDPSLFLELLNPNQNPRILDFHHHDNASPRPKITPESHQSDARLCLLDGIWMVLGWPLGTKYKILKYKNLVERYPINPKP